MRSKVIVLTLISLAGWVTWQRATAGNDYYKNRDTKEDSFNLIEDFFDMDISLKPLRYFSETEFGEWWPFISTDLLEKLDEFRHVLGVPVRISPAAGGIGRNGGVSTSQHNVDLWGEVRAIDVMFTGATLERGFEVAKQVGFTGIGVYPDWQPSQGMHLDVRQSPLALWSGVLDGGKQVYKSITSAFT